MKRILLPFCSLLFVVACGDDSSSANEMWLGADSSSSSSWIETTSSSSWQAPSSSSRNDVGSSSSSRNDLDLSSSSISAILSSSEAVSSSSEVLTDPLKIFDIRSPKGKVLPCEKLVVFHNDTSYFRDTLSQHDIICTYDYNSEKGFFYVQLTPNSCAYGMGITPDDYDVDKVQFYVNGKFEDVSAVNYEWGGNHHVERLWFTYKGNVYRYSQSSMGWGGRPCQDMDCLKVFESDGKTYVENGCNERSLPIVCRTVHGPDQVLDFTDDYKMCEGDPRSLGYDVVY